MSSNANERLRRPRFDDWPTWDVDDYLAYFLSHEAMQARLRGERSSASLLTADELCRFCKPIRDRLTHLFNSERPRIAILIPAYNEEVELLPTLLGMTRLDIEPGIAELIVADNNSSDRTSAIIKQCGAKYALCTVRGLGHCRRAAYEAMAPGTEYVWITDADTRVLPPLFRCADLERKSTVLRTSCRYLDEHPDLLGVSTGAVPEGAHWLFRTVRRLRLAMRKSYPLSCWSGANQFVRRWALDEIGGIDPSIESGEDHYRHFELARLGKRLGKGLHSANRYPALADPVYYSGRRYATLWLVLRHYVEAMTRAKLKRDEFGYPIHEKKIDWRQIRLGN